MKKIPWDKRCVKVGCVFTRAGLAYLKRPSEWCDVAEVRVDALRKERVKLDRIERAFAKRKCPVLLTLRTTAEGGCYPWKSRERVMIFQRLIPHVDAIDVELVNARLLKSVIAQAEEAGCDLILSAHSIKRKLTARKIDRLLKEFQNYPARIYKIAALGRTPKDVALLAKTLMEHTDLPLAMMAVGPMASVSRTVLPVLGSKLVYGYLDAPAAKNQPCIQKISSHLHSLGI